jgi:teichuronic acid biosynthesis glycosyltransferase TuaG
MYEDYDVWMRDIRTGVAVCGDNESLLIYRISRNSKSIDKVKKVKIA